MSSQKYIFMAALILSTTTLTSASLAGGANKVRSPYVTEGEWEIEHYGTYSFEHGSDDAYEYKSKTAVGYGLTTWWQVEVEGVLKDVPDNNLDYYATEFVNKFEFWEKGTHAIDMGLYLAYEAHKDSDKADAIEAFLLLGKDYGTSRHLANINFEQQIGSKRSEDLEVGVSWQSLWKIDEMYKAGFEYYGAFGEMNNIPDYSDQSHQIGPVVKFDIPHTGVEMKLGYLAGISKSAFDSAIKWELEYAF